MSGGKALRGRLLVVASWGEQQVRAYPRAYAAFYGVITRNERVRDAAGGLRDRVRGRASWERPGVAGPPPVDPVRRRVVAARLGLHLDDV